MIKSEFRVVSFTTAAPGWRLWLAGRRGEAREVALAGWVTLAQVEAEYDAANPQGEPVTVRDSGYRFIHPGWVYEGGQVVTVADEVFVDVGDVWVVGPGDRVPTSGGAGRVGQALPGAARAGVPMTHTAVVRDAEPDLVMKRCGRCHEFKPVEAFHRDRAKRDGIGRICKACANAQSRASYAAHQARAALDQDTQRCSLCGVDKPLDQFTASHRRCKPCRAERSRFRRNGRWTPPKPALSSTERQLTAEIGDGEAS